VISKTPCVQVTTIHKYVLNC